MVALDMDLQEANKAQILALKVDTMLLKGKNTFFWKKKYKIIVMKDSQISNTVHAPLLTAH